MSEMLLDLGKGLEIWKVNVDELIEQDVNARYMPPEMMNRLAKTIERDQRLESLPLVAKTEKGLEVVSGHHRTRASRMAEVEEIHVIVDTSGLDKSQIAAKQLAHNSISGFDDEQLLAKIYQSIDDVESRLEAFIDEKFETWSVENVSVNSISLDIKYRSALLLFLPYQLERFEEAIKVVERELEIESSETWVSDIKFFQEYRETIEKIKNFYDVRNMGTVLSMMSKIVLEKLDSEFDDVAEVVSIAELFGTSVLPKDVAENIKLAMDKMKANDDMTDKAKWRFIELLAMDYLGS